MERDLDVVEVHERRFFFGGIEEVLLLVERKASEWLDGLVIKGL